MKPFGLILKARTASPLAAAILLTASFALAPRPTFAETNEGAAVTNAFPSYEEEMRVEQTCKEWQKVRRCANAAGEVRFECAAKSPLAQFWAMLKGERKQDDEVKVHVIRRAPADSAAAADGKQSQAWQESSRVVESRQTKKVVKTSNLPRCQENG